MKGLGCVKLVTGKVNLPGSGTCLARVILLVIKIKNCEEPVVSKVFSSFSKCLNASVSEFEHIFLLANVWRERDAHICESSREMLIWKSCSETYLRPKVYLELSRTSTLEFFAKIFSRWKTLIIFAEKLYRSCSTRF